MKFTLSDVTVQFDAIPAINNISCEISEGSSLLVTGPTGAGKTTFLRLLYGDVIPTRGTVFIDGQLSASMKEERLLDVRRSMGLMFQDAKLLPSLTVFQNVIYPLIINGTPIPEANKRCLEILADIGVSYVRDKYPIQLSGGEKHLVGLARAIIHKPKVLIADEPTGNVDNDTTHTIANILKEQNSRGCTLIVATHDPFLADHFSSSQRIAFYEGKSMSLSASVQEH